MAIAFVQQIGGAATTSGQASLTSTATSFTAGNLLVAVVEWTKSGNTSASSISPPSGWSGNWQAENGASGTAGIGNGRAWFGYMPNNPGGSQSWTWTFTPNSGETALDWAYTILEFSGVMLSSPLDLAEVQNVTGSTSASPVDTSAASGTTAAGDLLIQLAALARQSVTISGSNSGSVPASGWTVGTEYDSTGASNPSPRAHIGAQYQIVSGTVTNPRGELTPSTNTSYESALLTFKQAVAAAPPPPPIYVVQQAIVRASTW